MANIDVWRKSWDPFRELNLMPRALDRWFEDIYSPEQRARMEKAVLSPTVEVKESKMAYMVRFDIPGVPKDAIKVDLHDNVLTVSGERKEETKEEDKDRKTHYSEVSYGSFSRSMTFPEAIDAEKAEAKYDSGVLTLTLAKKETTGKRQISVR